MSKLIITTEDNIVSEVELERRSYSIGRKPDNDVHIDDSTVSGSHAIVEVRANPTLEELDDIRIEDLGSTNGTLINGRKIKQAQLKNGDRVLLGSCEVRVETREAPEFEKTAIISKEGAAQGGGAWLQLLNGPRAGHAMQLVKECTSVGHSGITVVVSKRPEGWFVSQLEGHQVEDNRAPTVNGNRLGVEAIPLGEQDVIEIDGMQVQFRQK